MKRLFNWFMGCHHKNLSFPITRECSCGAVETYRVCLDCGTEFLYNFDTMRLGSRLENSH